MRVVQIVASIANSSHGPSYSVPRLADALAQAGAKVDLWTVGVLPSEEATDTGVRRQVFRHDLAWAPQIAHLRLSAALRRALADAARGDAAVLHAHGLWLAPNVYPATAARSAGKAFVVSPRGMLSRDAMRFSAMKKSLTWSLFQKRAVERASFIHATSEEECAEIRAMGLANPVAVIPNGIDVPQLSAKPAAPERTALSLGRIHPKKGLERLVRGWGKAGAATKGWRLRIVGPDEDGHAGQLRTLIAELGLANAAVEGPIYGEDKLAALRQASLFVLPTLNENFALAAAEALAAATPVISTKGAPWSGLAVEGCGWWIDHGEEAMAAALRTALALPRSELARMGALGRQWMLRDFGWDGIGRRMLAAYDWAVSGGSPPADIRQ